MMEVAACGPGVTVQDDGRPGHLSLGLARGGAADGLARVEAAALLGEIGAGLEIPGVPLSLVAKVALGVAMTGAPMRAAVEGRALAWNAAHVLAPGARLDLRPSGEGVYSYLHVVGGFDTERVLGSRSAHAIAGIGAVLAAGDALPCAASDPPSRRLAAPEDRFGGGAIRVVATPQTALFPEDEVARFEATEFTRDPRGNRQGVRLAMEGAGFATEGQLALLSDFIRPGDLQMTGDGAPYLLGPECQTTGGYPRIGTVIAADLPRALQAPPGARLRFRFVPLSEARAARWAVPRVEPLVRSPGEVPDLLSKQLIGGVVSAREG